MDLFGVDSNLWTAGAAVAQTIIIGVAAAFAYRQVREAQLTREDQSRPFVIVSFDMSQPPLISLVITNIGSTIARRVRIQTDPPLASSLDNDGLSQPIAKLRPFSDEIPTLAPQEKIHVLFDSFPQREQAKLDDAYRVTVSYEGERGRAWVEDMTLDLGIYRNIQYVHRNTIHDVHGQLEKIAKEVRRWSAQGSGLLVVSRNDQREDHARAVRRFRTRPDASFAPPESSEPTAQWELRRLRRRLGKALAVLSDRVDPEER